MKNSYNFCICLAISTAIHLLVVLMLLFGLPHVSKKYKDDQEQIIGVAMLQISDITNIEPQQQIVDYKHNKTNTQTPKANANFVKQKQITTAEEKVTSHTGAILKNNKKSPDHKLQTQGKVLKQTASKKKITRKDELESLLNTLEQNSKKINKKVASKDELKSLLNTLEQRAQSNSIKLRYNKPSTLKEHDITKKSTEPVNNLLLLSISEQNLIKQQIQKQWIIPTALQNKVGVAVTLHVHLNKDGSVAAVKVLTKICQDISPAVCQALAESAQRAVWQASPIKYLLPETYDTWQEFSLSFYPGGS